jgi:hypothetical protein
VSKGKYTFKESDADRGIRVAQKAGLRVTKFRIKRDEIEFEVAPATGATTAVEPESDEWKVAS